MIWLPRVILLTVVTAIAAGAIAPAHAQQVGPPDTLSIPERASWENGYLSLFNMDRSPTGARIMAMGGSGMALAAGPQYQLLNPASILGAETPWLEAETKVYAGSAAANEVPALLDLGGGQFLRTSNYRIRPKEDFDYNNLSFALPVVLFGNRGTLGASYIRHSRTGNKDETRVGLQGPVTNEAEATFGIGNLPEQGMDMISVAAARKILPWLDLGVNLNWYSGTLERTVDYGISIFGAEIPGGGGGIDFAQDVSSFNLDIGTRLDLGRFELSGVTYLGHDLEFKKGAATVRPIPNPQDPTQTIIPQLPYDMTINVPTMFGLGGAFHVSDRLLLTGDYWIRPWSKAEVTRVEIEPFIGFADPDDPATYFFLLPAALDSTGKPARTESFNARIDDTNSLRLGLEYLLVDNATFRMPVRLGFRSETLTQVNVAVPDIYENYLGLVQAYWTAWRLDPAGDLTLALENALKEVAEFNNQLFRGEGISANTFTLGVGFEIHNFNADVSLEQQSYDLTTWFLQPFDPLLNPIPATVQESRSLTNLIVSVGWRF